MSLALEKNYPDFLYSYQISKLEIQFYIQQVSPVYLAAEDNKRYTFIDSDFKGSSYFKNKGSKCEQIIAK